ncbi:MAG: hypothetical protein DRI93_02825 [Aquificota bacterium]|nr:MAG: hypothetical protein DRI93_02825 [Aquificota bacterium]
MESSSSLRVLHLVAIRGKGGTGASTLSLVEGLADRGHRVAVVCFKRGLLYQSLKDEGKVELITGIKMASGLRIHEWVKDLRRLRPFVKEFKPHIIHTHSSPDYWLGFLLSLMTGAALVRSRHVPVPLKPHAFNRLLFRKTAAVLAVSHAVGDKYFSGVNWKPERVRVIYDGVDVERFHPGVDGGAVRRKIGLDRGHILVGSLARYSRVKGLPYFLKALGRLMERDSRIHGLVAGRVKSKSLYRNLKEWLMEKEMEERVTLWGHQTRIQEVLAALDVVVLASLGSEGSSRVALEAGASGKPLIATTVGALPEVVVHGKTGLLVPPGEVEELETALQRTLLPLMGKKFGLNFYFRIRRTFAREVTVESVERIYRSIVQH